MSVILLPDQQRWLEAQVASGAFPTLEAAAQAAIAAAIADQTHIETDELAWTLPLVEAARADVASGSVLTLDEHRSRMAERIAALKR